MGRSKRFYTFSMPHIHTRPEHEGNFCASLVFCISAGAAAHAAWHHKPREDVEENQIQAFKRWLKDFGKRSLMLIHSLAGKTQEVTEKAYQITKTPGRTRRNSLTMRRLATVASTNLEVSSGCLDCALLESDLEISFSGTTQEPQPQSSPEVSSVTFEDLEMEG